MNRRTQSKAKTIDAVFPIRVKVTYGKNALPGLTQAIERWAAEELGRGRVATHTSAMVGGNDCILYFRTLGEAKKCLSEFEELRLRDWVGQTNLEREGRDYGVFAQIRKADPSK